METSGATGDEVSDYGHRLSVNICLFINKKEFETFAEKVKQDSRRSQYLEKMLNLSEGIQIRRSAFSEFRDHSQRIKIAVRESMLEELIERYIYEYGFKPFLVKWV